MSVALPELTGAARQSGRFLGERVDGIKLHHKFGDARIVNWSNEAPDIDLCEMMSHGWTSREQTKFTPARLRFQTKRSRKGYFARPF